MNNTKNNTCITHQMDDKICSDEILTKIREKYGCVWVW